MNEQFITLKPIVIKSIDAQSKGVLKSYFANLSKDTILKLTVLYYIGNIYMEDNIGDTYKFINDKLNEYNHFNTEHLIDKFEGVYTDVFSRYLKDGWYKLTGERI